MNSDDMDYLISASNEISELFVSQDNDVDQKIQDYLASSKISSSDDFQPGAEWFNVSEPLSFKQQLKGKVVVLDFFTYCCINCMHVLPDLKAIEENFSIEDGLVVIGVHSAKFQNEKDSNNVLSAVQRYNISHPVVNDAKSEVWNKFNVSCWPTLIILGPHANPLFLLMGEGHKDELMVYIRNILDHYKAKGEISNHKLPILPANHLLPKEKGPLLFPGKIASFKINDEDMLAISDTGNHRILLSSPRGTVYYVIGGIEPGFRDGDFQEARFNAPQGLVFFNEMTLFVADTENHAIRKIDLDNKIVTTVAGIGVQGLDRLGGKPGLEQAISSPWDVCVYSTLDLDMTFHAPDDVVNLKNVLLISMAGTHQIWALFLDDIVWWKFKKFSAGTCVAIAGSGREENRNNVYPHAAAFAQPSGLALAKDQKEVFIADSESSAIRRLSLTDGKVTGVVGGDKNPRNLFAYGDVQGSLYNGKLQHPLGVAWSSNGYLYVADSYNHKIKRVDTSTNTVYSLYGNGVGDKPIKDYSIQFNEPGGLCVSSDGNILYVADTNNHSVKMFDLTKTSNAFIGRIPFTLPQNNSNSQLDVVSSINEINVNGAVVTLKFVLKFSSNLKLTDGAPHYWKVEVPNQKWLVVQKSAEIKPNAPLECKINVQPDTAATNNKLNVKFSLMTCEGNICKPMFFNLTLPFVSAQTGLNKVDKSFLLTVGNNGIKLS